MDFVGGCGSGQQEAKAEREAEQQEGNISVATLPYLTSCNTPITNHIQTLYIVHPEFQLLHNDALPPILSISRFDQCEAVPL